MEYTLSGLLVGALATCLGLYAVWKFAEAVHYANLRRRIKRRRDTGYDPVCRVDGNGNVFTVRYTGEHGGGAIPDFLRRRSQD